MIHKHRHHRVLQHEYVLARGKVLGHREGDSGNTYNERSFSISKTRKLKETHTLRREGDALSTIRDSRNLINLEPDCTISRPSIDIRRCLRHVHVHDTRMVDGAVAHDTELRSSCDRNRCSGVRSVGLRVVATEVSGGDIGDGGLGVEVVGFADVHPGGGRGAADDERGEGVCARKRDSVT